MSKLTKLKNGSQELDTMVIVTMRSLQHLAKNDPITLYELVEKCKDKDHVIWGDCESNIKALGLMTRVGVHESIKNITLSAVIGTGLDITLCSPYLE
jgi:hypothetical protein